MPKKSSKSCPKCGGNTVIETDAKGKKIRRCDDFVLNPKRGRYPSADDWDICPWEEEIHSNGRVVETRCSRLKNTPTKKIIIKHHNENAKREGRSIIL